MRAHSKVQYHHGMRQTIKNNGQITEMNIKSYIRSKTLQLAHFSSLYGDIVKVISRCAFFTEIMTRVINVSLCAYLYLAIHLIEKCHKG